MNMDFYIIPSPIGNLDDITIRSIQVLNRLDFLVVENRSKAKIILQKHEVQIEKILVYNDKSNQRDRNKII